MGIITEVVGQYNITKMSDGNYSVSLNNGNIGAFVTDENGVQKIREKYNQLSPAQKNRIEQQRLFNNPLERQPQGDTVQFTSGQKNIVPTEESKKNKKGWLAAAAGLAVAIGAIIITKGRAAKKAKAMQAIPDDLKVIFNDLKGKNGKEFIDAAYEKMVNYMGLKGIAPQKIGHSGGDGLAITGGYNPIDNIIEYSDGFFNKLPKMQQLNCLSHELKHCQQFSTILKTEGITVEQYARVVAENAVNSAIKKSSLDNLMFKIHYEKAVAAGKGEEFIEKAIQNQVKGLIPKIEKNFADVLKMPKIPANSPEAQKALEYLEAERNYEGLGIFGLGSDAYRNNPLELEAYAFGGGIEKMFKDYLKYS